MKAFVAFYYKSMPFCHHRLNQRLRKKPQTLWQSRIWGDICNLKIELKR
jgi:hypothetical protein